MADSNKGKKLELPSVELLEAELKKEKYRSNFGRVLKSTVFSLLVVAAAAVIIAMLIMPVVQISGVSMADTLQDGDIIISVSGASCKTGDIVAFYYNNNILIKRVIASAGDWVDIDRMGNVSVNGEMLYEPYVTDKSFGECNIELPYQVPDGKYFLMGDHRETSIDSRNSAIGCISDDVVIGKLLLRVWPLAGFGIIK